VIVAVLAGGASGGAMHLVYAYDRLGQYKISREDCKTQTQTINPRNRININNEM